MPTPTSSAAAPVRPALSTRVRISPPPPTSPTTASASTATLSKVIRAPMLLSARRTPSTSRPLASFSTANRVRPSSVFAATRVTSAEAPWTTNCLLPDRRKPLPERSARIAIASGRCLAPSSIAIAPTVSPASRPGNQRSRSALPLSASTKATALVRKGDGVRLRPISSSTIPASTWPRPRPPSASSIRMPVKPISANCFHRPWPKPSLQPLSRQWRSCFAIAPSSAMKLRAVSRSMDWSSVR